MYRSFVSSILLFSSVKRTLLADSTEKKKKKGFQAFKTKIAKAWENFSASLITVEHKTNIWVRSKINFLVSLQGPLLATITRWKLAWLGHTICRKSLTKTILQGTLQDRQCQGWPRNAGHGQHQRADTLPLPEQLTMVCWRRAWKRIFAD